ncbi:MAG: hypothetical protein U0169_18940 [Polyangiaceae bacterium]
MRTEKDVEAYLLRLRRRFQPVGDSAGTYLLETTSELPAIAVRVNAPLVVLRVDVVEVTTRDPLPLFKRLLELNSKSLVFASYGLDGTKIALQSALELENLDFNELQATLDEFELALAQQSPQLRELAK